MKDNVFSSEMNNLLQKKISQGVWFELLTAVHKFCYRFRCDSHELPKSFSADLDSIEWRLPAGKSASCIQAWRQVLFWCVVMIWIFSHARFLRSWCLPFHFGGVFCSQLRILCLPRLEMFFNLFITLYQNGFYTWSDLFSWCNSREHSRRHLFLGLRDKKNLRKVSLSSDRISSAARKIRIVKNEINRRGEMSTKMESCCRKFTKKQISRRLENDFAWIFFSAWVHLMNVKFRELDSHLR